MAPASLHSLSLFNCNGVAFPPGFSLKAPDEVGLPGGELGAVDLEGIASRQGEQVLSYLVYYCFFKHSICLRSSFIKGMSSPLGS